VAEPVLEPALEPVPKRSRWESSTFPPFQPLPPPEYRAGLLSYYGGVHQYMLRLRGELPWPDE
jgi:hypothetical protein